MGYEDVFQNAISSAVGDVAKAKIRIYDNRGRKNASLKEGDMAKQKSGGSSKFGSLEATVGGLSDNLLKKAASKFAGKEKVNPVGIYNRELTVQFNPSSLQLSSVAGDDDMQITSYNSTASGVKTGAVKLHIELSVKLIFDQVSNNAAFVQDLLTLDSSKAIGMATSAVGNAINSRWGTTPQSVQVIVEAFTAAMRNENTRRVCFEWGEFCYEGIISRMNTNYTMFDISGNPVRAEVSMVLYLVDEDTDKDFDEYWKDAYFDAFIDGNIAAMAMMELAEKGLI